MALSSSSWSFSIFEHILELFKKPEDENDFGTSARFILVDTGWC